MNEKNRGVCRQRRNTVHSPQGVRPQDSHKLLFAELGKSNSLTHDARVSEKDIEPSVALDSVIDDFLHARLIGGVETPGVDLDGGEGGDDLGLVGFQMCSVIVADVDCAGTAFGELVSGGATDAEE